MNTGHQAKTVSHEPGFRLSDHEAIAESTADSVADIPFEVPL
jgi:hypothetical protein